MQRNFSAPDESIVTEMSRFDVVRLGSVEVTRATYQPGWNWLKHSQPNAGGTSCQESHRWYVLSGSLHLRMEDGSEAEWNAGDLGEVPPGHIAWVVSNEPFVALLF